SQPHPFWGPTLLLLYWTHLESNEREEANRVFQRLLKLNTSEDEKSFVQWLAAQTLFAEGKVLDALPYYFSIVNSKFREKALFQIGKGYFIENQFREALTNFDLLLLQFPNSRFLDEALLIKGECLLHLGDTPRASETYSKVSAHSGENPWYLMALTQTGILHLSQQAGEKAEEVFNRVLKEFPDDPLFYYSAFQLGVLAEKRKDFQGASHFYSLVLRGGLPELLGPTYFRIGEVFMLQEKEEKALVSFERALEYLSENSLWFGITQLEIGNLQRRRGKVEEAKHSYRIVQNQSNDEEIRKAAKQLLDRLEMR
ncbi:MAG TPA: tetratricopeptide repeat protein, partial [Thermodesulfobacteriota bacterium]|nr:tetratricopeptide repeat protein [Thermodesulfobacteriota bacterium]